MTLMQLQYFIILARELNYTRTAEIMHISQPSLSYAVTALEKDLGVPLFIREKKKIKLSRFGEGFLPYAKQAISTLDEGVKTVQRMERGTDTSSVTLGYFYSISSDFIPSIAEGFKKKYGDNTIDFSFVQLMNKDLLNELKEGNIDLAFCVTSDKSVESVKIGEQPLYAVVPHGHPLADRDHVTVADLAQEKIILLHKNSGLRATVERLFSDESVPLHIAYETQECNSALQFVNIGKCISILPRIPAMELQPVVAIPLSGQYAHRSVFLSWKKNAKLSSQATQVRDYILKEWKSIEP